MAFEVKPNTGSLWANDRKEQDSHPDRTGNGVIECPHCGKSWTSWINGWLKKSKDGKPYLSLSFKPKEERGQQRGGGQGGGNAYAERRDSQRPAGPNVGGSWRDRNGPKDDDGSIPF